MSKESIAADVEVDDPGVVNAVVVKDRPSWVWKIVTKTPLFAYILLLYLIMEWQVANMRSIIFVVGPYALSYVEVLYCLAAMVAMIELLRVSEPGIDNTLEALGMLAIFIICLIFFVLGAAKVWRFGLFSTTEFLVLLLISGTQVALAFLINARTLKRTIDYSGGHH